MKFIKIILLFASIVFFTSIPLKAKAGHDGESYTIDCATAVKLHEKAICKMRGEDTSSGTAKKEKTKKKKEKKKITKHKEVKEKIEKDAKGLWKALTEAVAKEEPAVIEVRLETGSEVSPWPFILRDAFCSKFI